MENGDWDEHGEFRMSGLWPDMDLSVGATAPAYSVAGAKVLPPEKGNERVIALKIARADESVDGIVRDSSGKALEGIQVSITGNSTKNQVAHTDKNGSFNFNNLVAGDKVTIQLIYMVGLRSSTARKEIIAGMDKTVEIQIDPPTTQKAN